MTEKTAVLAPIPTAITMMAMAVKPGILVKERSAKRRSRQASSIQRKDDECSLRLLAVSGPGVCLPTTISASARLCAGTILRSWGKQTPAPCQWFLNLEYEKTFRRRPLEKTKFLKRAGQALRR